MVNIGIAYTATDIRGCEYDDMLQIYVDEKQYKLLTGDTGRGLENAKARVAIDRVDRIIKELVILQGGANVLEWYIVEE